MGGVVGPDEAEQLVRASSGHRGVRVAPLSYPPVAGQLDQVRLAVMPAEVIERCRVGHCIACQFARMALASASSVAPVSTSPALLMAAQMPPSALKPW